jgi:hypothetical protein
MHNFKKLGALTCAVLALCAITAVSASAAAFTYSATGTIVGKALTGQTFTFSAGQLKCLGAETTGAIVSTNSQELHLTVSYKSCTALGFAGVDVSPMTYVLTANGEVHIKGAMTTNVTGAACHLTVDPQTRKSVTYTNNFARLKVAFNLTGLVYTSTGGLCGAGGANGTLTGEIELERVGGGTISHDP